ncbi:dynein axonemal heavy chain 6-like [Menidia menidia]
MASGSPRHPPAGGQPSTEWQRSLSELHAPRPPGPVKDPQALLRRRLPRKHPSPQHSEAGERMIFPGWDVQPSAHGGAAPPRPQPPAQSSQKVGVARGLRQQRVIGRAVRSPASDCSADLRSSNLLQPQITQVMREVERGPNKHHINLCRLQQVPFFAHYLTWKCLYFWSSNVIRKKLPPAIKIPTGFLRNFLPSASETLGAALLEIREICSQALVPDFFQLKRKHTHTLLEFRSSHVQHLEEVSLALDALRQKVKQATLDAGCDYKLEHEQRGGEISEFLQEAPLEEQEDGWQRAISACFSCRYIHFIRLVDYLLMDILHNLVVKAAKQLLAFIQEQMEQAPVHTDLPIWSLDLEPEAYSQNQPAAWEACSTRALFVCDVWLSSHSQTFSPSRQDCEDAILELIGRFEGTAALVKPLRADPQFAPFTLVNKYEGLRNKYRNGPSLQQILNTDSHLQNIKQSIRDLLQEAFEASERYIQSYIQSFCCVPTSSKETQSLDLDVMRMQGWPLESFKKALQTYTSKHQKASDFEDHRRFGLLLLNNSQLKEKILTSSLSALQDVHQALLEEATKQRDGLFSELREATLRLEFQPSTTAELAESLMFLDAIEGRVLELARGVESVCEMYALIKSYSLPMALEEHMEFSSLCPCLDHFLGSVAGGAGQSRSFLTRFSRLLHADLQQLQLQAAQLRLRMQVSSVLDLSADAAQVRVGLEEIKASIEGLQAQASLYNSYQQRLKMAVTELPALLEMDAELRLTQLLWDSLKQWEALQAGWQQSALRQLLPDQICSQIAEFSRRLAELEAGLPPNSLVPLLRVRVEAVRQKLPVISHLWHLSMSRDDWRTLTPVLGSGLNRNEVTVAALEELNIYSYQKEIQEASAAAEREAQARCEAQGVQAPPAEA